MNQRKVLLSIGKSVRDVGKAPDAVSSFSIAVDIVVKELLVEKDLHDEGLNLAKLQILKKWCFILNPFKHKGSPRISRRYSKEGTLNQFLCVPSSNLCALLWLLNRPLKLQIILFFAIY
jgi:hypothetical protein